MNDPLYYDAVCPSDYSEIAGGCYSAHAERKTWIDAEADCQTRSGHLVWLETEEEWDNLSGKCKGSFIKCKGGGQILGQAKKNLVVL